ncbi:aminoacyl-tRNA hydrolase [Chloroflexota bacterium]
MKLIVGLGNPGRHYANNRHNIGFMCLNHFAKTQSIGFNNKQGQARTGRGEVAGSEVLLAKPQTYMNLSGQSVSRLVKIFNINLNNLVVIHDDLDLPLGTIRFHRGGGWTTHKGVRSVIAELGSGDYSLLRVGIGRPAENKDTTEFSNDEIITYVLGDFTPDEKHTITQVIPKVSEAILCLLTEGLMAAMNQYN